MIKYCFLPKLIFLLPLVFGCQRVTSVPPSEAGSIPSPAVRIADPEVEANRHLWINSEIRNYDMEIDGNFGNGIGGPANNVKISVRDGLAVSISSRRPEDTRPLDAYNNVETVGKMFQYIGDLQEQTRNSGKVDALGHLYPAVRVKFDKKWGYPIEIGILWEPAADAWTIYTLKRFTPVTPTDEK